MKSALLFLLALAPTLAFADALAVVCGEGADNDSFRVRHERVSLGSDTLTSKDKKVWSLEVEKRDVEIETLKTVENESSIKQIVVTAKGSSYSFDIRKCGDELILVTITPKSGRAQKYDCVCDID